MRDHAQLYRRKRRDATVDAAVAAQGSEPGDILAVLKTAQELSGGHLPSKVLGAAADALAVSDARVQGIATFYSQLSVRPRSERIIRVCDGPVCMLHGASSARPALEAVATCDGWIVERRSCLGLCDRAPAALVGEEPCGPIAVASADLILAGWRGDTPSYAQPRSGEVRVSMARIGHVDPDSIDSALAKGAYQVLARALGQDPNNVIDTVERSGLCGYGGAGFPAGRKWRLAAQATSQPKVVVCNADESEPGTFKDRVLLDGDPHSLLEGMALAGYAVGAAHGFIYIRGEYEWIARRLERAMAQAEERGWLGENIRGTGFTFRVEVHRGAGAYVCGEETALLESLEGKRGEPRFRPPYAVTHGYQGRPTVINNVETLCLVPPILSRGADWFRSLGTAHSPGTKVFTITGCVNRPGAFEVPLGVTLRQLIDDFAGGLPAGARFKAALTGGAAGMFVPAKLLDVPVDFASGRDGVPLGAGAVIVLDDSVSIPTVLAWLLHFFEVESCGKCTPCRVGTREARLIGERLADGRGSPQDLKELGRLARMLDMTSLCGLGRSVAWPIESALCHFHGEFGSVHSP